MKKKNKYDGTSIVIYTNSDQSIKYTWLYTDAVMISRHVPSFSTRCM